MFTRFILVLSLFVLLTPAQAAQLHGRILGAENDPLPFANVYIKGTTNGTLSNIEGYYTFSLSPGNYTIVFRYLGYKLKEVAVQMGDEPVKLDMHLEPEDILLSEVHVRATDEDPAYRIMRETIRKRSYYLKQVEAYNCDVYIKGVQRLLNMPDKIMGFSTSNISINGMAGNDSNLRGIIYLSESVSKFSFRQPDQIHEEMISSKVSGSNNAFSYNKAGDMLLNFYKNHLELDELSDRGFVSPIAANAMFYYRYKLLGTFTENGYLVNKIAITPKRKSDPCFRGTIHIIDNEWRLHSLNLMVTNSSPLNFVDTLRIDQVFAPVEPGIWMPISNGFSFSFDVMGVRGNGYYRGVNSNYVLNPQLNKKIFKGEEWKVMDESNKKDSLYWEQVRPLPLTAEEQVDYHRKDSMLAVHESKAYMDSVDRKFNRFRLKSFFLSGYTKHNRYKKETWNVSGFLPSMQFNTVEGFLAQVNFSYNKELEHKKRFFVSPTFRYGFSNRHFNPKILVFGLLDNKKFQSVYLNGGSDVQQYNAQNPISPFLNTVYSLLDEKNYMKVFEKQFVKAGYRQELVNGIFLRTDLEWAYRYSVQNSNNFSLIDDVYGTYSSNDPQNKTNTMRAFDAHQATVLNVSAVFRIRQKYYSRPDQKIITGSKYPTLFASYRKGIHSLFQSDVNFDVLTAGMKDDMRLGLPGTFSYHVKAGQFINNRHLYFMDYAHASTNRTFWMSKLRDRGDIQDDDGQNISGFNLLDYYKLSTSNNFVEAHAEQHFNGFFLNKFPLLRKTRFQEVVGVHYLLLDGKVNYAELAVGLEHIGLGNVLPGFLRIDYVTSWADIPVPVKQGIRFGLGF